jgi:hypothetical protein
MLYHFFFNVFETGSHYTAQVGLELEIFLPLPPESQNYRGVSLPNVVLQHVEELCEKIILQMGEGK